MQAFPPKSGTLSNHPAMSCPYHNAAPPIRFPRSFCTDWSDIRCIIVQMIDRIGWKGRECRTGMRPHLTDGILHLSRAAVDHLWTTDKLRDIWHLSVRIAIDQKHRWEQLWLRSARVHCVPVQTISLQSSNCDLNPTPLSSRIAFYSCFVGKNHALLVFALLCDSENWQNKLKQKL